VVFVPDDLGARLVGKLADAGSHRLITWMLGSEQERALRQAATAAVQLTAAELHPEGRERAGELATVVRSSADPSADDLQRIVADPRYTPPSHWRPLPHSGHRRRSRAWADVAGIK
jgi:hypothetical protein